MNVLVTGGSGFLGRAIVNELLEPTAPFRSDLVRILDVNEYQGKHKDKVAFIKGSVTDYHIVLEACKGIDLVIHSAAIIDWGTKSDAEIYAANYTGTVNVVKACEEFKIRNLIYTSSLDAIYSSKPLIDVDDTYPYPEKHSNSYCRTKYLSEVHVMEHTSDQLRTCILRPSDIFGEEDPFHIGSLINMAKSGFYVRLGNGKAKSQHVYVRNMAHAHLQAAKAILDGNTNLLGKAYLITDGPGGNFFHFFDRIVEGAGYKIWPKNFWIPRPIGMVIGSIADFIAFIMRPINKYHPKMSRFAVIYTCTDFTFNSERAKRDWGFVPKFTPEEAFQKTVAYYRKDK